MATDTRSLEDLVQEIEALLGRVTASCAALFVRPNKAVDGFFAEHRESLDEMRALVEKKREQVAESDHPSRE